MNASHRLIIRNNDQFRNSFSRLDDTSVVCCRLRLKPGEEHILVDLQRRGVTLIPSATAQLAGRSKVHQARIFTDFMVPHTLVAYDANQLLEATSRYRELGIGEVVMKQDRKNGGLGIHRFKDIEDVYNTASFGRPPYPVVIQPFIGEFRDIRVVLLGNYIEAYERINPFNFRHNLHCGGRAEALDPGPGMVELCRRVMDRGNFPYAHIDLMILPDDTTYLTEINLRGGLRGAAIDAVSYEQKIKQLHETLLADTL